MVNVKPLLHISGYLYISYLLAASFFALDFMGMVGY